MQTHRQDREKKKNLLFTLKEENLKKIKNKNIPPEETQKQRKVQSKHEGKQSEKTSETKRSWAYIYTKAH